MKKSILREMLIILAVSAVLGLAANAFNPRGVDISSKRLVRASAADLLLTAQAADGPLLIDRTQLKMLTSSGEALLIDARTLEEFIAGHLPGAINIAFESLGEFVEQMEALPKEKWLICYCDGPPCDKGEMLARELFGQRFPFTAFYDAGLDDWRTAGEEVER